MEHMEVISNCETGNPPEGWESEGQYRIAKSAIIDPQSTF